MNIALFISGNIGVNLMNYLIKKNQKIIIVTNNYSLFYILKLKIKTIFYNKKNLDILIENLKENNIELGITAGFTVIPKKIWDFPKYKFINLHYSLLYSYGGPNPIEWQLHNKEKETGVTVHFISNKKASFSPFLN